MSEYFSVQDHREMVFDALRNNFYADAINNNIKTDSVVLDLGAGLGLHGFMAALSGAKKIYLVDPSPVVKIADMVVKANDLADNVTCIQKSIQEIDLPEKVDIIISVFTGNFLLTEDLLPTLFYARDKYLSESGRLIPDRAIMEVVPVTVSKYYNERISTWSEPTNDVDFSLVRQYAANSLYYDEPEIMKPVFLAEPAELLDMDFMTATEAACRNRSEVEITKSGLCHGWLGWFKTHVGDQWLSTSPLEEQMHWRQVFLPLNEPVEVNVGDSMFFELNRPEFGEWTWTVETAGNRQRQSTFLSEPISSSDLLKKSGANKAVLSEKGRAVLDVLQLLNGSYLTAEIVVQIMKTYPSLFANQNQAAQFVKKLVTRYS